MRVIAFYCETTGLGASDEMLQLCVCVCDMDEFGYEPAEAVFHNFYFVPVRPFGKYLATPYNGITWELLGSLACKTVSESSAAIEALINDPDGDFWVGHNINFDIGFLRRAGIWSDKDKNCICTMRMAGGKRVKLQNLPRDMKMASGMMDDITAHGGLVRSLYHDAIADVAHVVAALPHLDRSCFKGSLGFARYMRVVNARYVKHHM